MQIRRLPVFATLAALALLRCGGDDGDSADTAGDTTDLVDTRADADSAVDTRFSDAADASPDAPLDDTDAAPDSAPDTGDADTADEDAPGDAIDEEDASPSDLGDGDDGTATCPDDSPYFVEGRPLRVTLDGLAIVDGGWDERLDLAFVIDSGAQFVSYDLDLTDGATDVFTTETTSLGTTVLCGVPSKGRDLAEGEAWAGVNIDALLGQSALKGVYTFIDYAGLEAWFYKEEPPTSPPSVDAVEPSDFVFALQSELPVADVGLTDDAIIPLLADTGSAATIIEAGAYEAAAAAYEGTLPRLDGYVFSTNWGTDDAFVSRLPELRLGDAVVTGEWVVVIPTDNHVTGLLEGAGVVIDGFLGYPTFRHFLVESRGPDSMFRLWPYGDAAPVPENEWNHVGLALSSRPEGMRVEMIFSPSAVAETVIEVGDWLTHVDGDPVDAMALDEARNRLRGAPGDRRVLRVRSATTGETADYDLQVEDLLPPL